MCLSGTVLHMLSVYVLVKAYSNAHVYMSMRLAHLHQYAEFVLVCMHCLHLKQTFMSSHGASGCGCALFSLHARPCSK